MFGLFKTPEPPTPRILEQDLTFIFEDGLVHAVTIRGKTQFWTCDEVLMSAETNLRLRRSSWLEDKGITAEGVYYPRHRWKKVSIGEIKVVQEGK